MTERKKLNKDTFGLSRWEDKTLIQFIEESLTADPYDGGVIEQSAARAEKTSKAFGRLLDWLYDQGAISKPEVYGILGRHFDPEEHDE